MPIRQIEHPAKYSQSIADQMAECLSTQHLPIDGDKYFGRVWDPFGGTGRIHSIVDAVVNKPLLAITTEIEWEWAGQSNTLGRGRSVVADMQHAPFRPESFVAIATSPCYGNRMADHHENKDPCSQCKGTGRGVEIDTRDTDCKKCKGDGRSVRNTYRHKLGRALTPGSAAMLQWGPNYRAFHEKAWGEVWLHLKPHGLFILNVSDHIRAGVREHVSDWHNKIILSMPFTPVDALSVETRRNKQGENGNLRVNSEMIFVYRKR